MTDEEQNSAAIDLVEFALRAGYKIEMYSLYICVDDDTQTVLLSPADAPVTINDDRRKKTIRANGESFRGEEEN